MTKDQETVQLTGKKLKFYDVFKLQQQKIFNI